MASGKKFVVIATDSDGNEYVAGRFVTMAEALEAKDEIDAEGETAKVVTEE